MAKMFATSLMMNRFLHERMTMGTDEKSGMEEQKQRRRDRTAGGVRPSAVEKRAENETEDSSVCPSAVLRIQKTNSTSMSFFSDAQIDIYGFFYFAATFLRAHSTAQMNWSGWSGSCRFPSFGYTKFISTSALTTILQWSSINSLPRNIFIYSADSAGSGSRRRNDRGKRDYVRWFCKRANSPSPNTRRIRFALM